MDYSLAHHTHRGENRIEELRRAIPEDRVTSNISNSLGETEVEGKVQGI